DGTCDRGPAAGLPARAAPADGRAALARGDRATARPRPQLSRETSHARRAAAARSALSFRRSPRSRRRPHFETNRQRPLIRTNPMSAERQFSQRADDEALAWATRLDGGDLSPAELAVLDAWLATDPSHAWRLAACEQFYAQLHATLPAMAA